MQLDKKTIDIRTTAYLKSVIESGANEEQWEVLLKKALVVHSNVLKWQMNILTGGNNGKG